MKLLQTIFFSFMGITVLVVGIILFRNWKKSMREVKEIHASKISGIIKSYKNLGRTMYDLKIQDGDKAIVVSCAGFNTYNKVFKLEDSIFKKAYSDTALIFRKSDSGTYDYQGFIITGY
ncbi:MAG: hypothetical protein JO154_11185 [Chitinophaga sp.]|uniref:hypothetical protein n=1 Tax=Chitinophaga sp. TaxID=1869181 RepID=UPI0025BF79C9|nr:hypothetical protein [Chitinophaga sp.]MBV8253160.1 hypothetical protein [Chitinophaga sp.]